MKQLKPRDKVTQHMTRDGLTLDNQTRKMMKMVTSSKMGKMMPKMKK